MVLVATGAVTQLRPAAWASPAIAVNPAPAPAFNPNPACPNGSPGYNFPGSGDAADPQIVSAGATYYAFTTGNALGNHLAALTSSSPNSGFAPYTGTCSGSTALAHPSSWEEPNTQTSPGVFNDNGRWIMFYDAAQSGHPGDTGFDCLAVATAGSLSPTGAQFTDSGSPLLCQSTGSIDPSPFIDPVTGQAYLVWKQNDGGSNGPASIWSQPLAPSGTAFAPGTSPSLLFTNNTVLYPWETTVEDPSMAYTDGTYYLLFSAGVYSSNSYSEGITSCSSPTTGCGPHNQILSSYGTVLGPGGGALFSDPGGNWWIDYAAWQGGSPGCTNYGCGAARRLFVAPINLPNSNPNVPCSAPAGGPDGYRFVAGDGGIFTFGNLAFCGSEGGQHLNSPVVGMAATSSGGGYWEAASDGGIFTFGDATFHGSAGGEHLNQPVVGMAATPDGKGYWLVARDGGIFTYGDANFYGSAGGEHLNQPVVGMAATPDGGGYWLVASDGGIFTYGDANFYGSEGGQPLNQPVVGMAAAPGGAGYWEVAADGGIFAFGFAPFFGSTGGQHLNQPVVGMATF
ncbi:MAG TPA: family 43 glycosylhydrolase [Acidimicrobiales bacterium]|nr:family 43 glycosylhydrolase [Acidimicrobiales bacterium]